MTEEQHKQLRADMRSSLDGEISVLHRYNFSETSPLDTRERGNANLSVGGTN